MLFLYKPDFQFRQAKVEKKVCLPAEAFEKFLRDPLQDVPCVVENKDLMCQDKEGVYHCLLVTGEGRQDGLLVESEGSGYARYASYVPEATALRYPTLSKMNMELAAVVDAIISEGIGRAAEGNWTVSFAELEDMTGLCVEGKPFLQETLGDMLRSRPEVTDLVIEDGQFDVAYHLDLCPGCQKGTDQKGMERSGTNGSVATPGMFLSM